jgi:hypothetical protein
MDEKYLHWWCGVAVVQQQQWEQKLQVPSFLLPEFNYWSKTNYWFIESKWYHQSQVH